MKKSLTFFTIFMFSLFVFGQNDFIEKKIEEGKILKKYINGKVDSIIILTDNASNPQVYTISKRIDEIRITNVITRTEIKIQVKNKKQVKTLLRENEPLFTIENIDFDLNNLPKNAIIYNNISKENIIIYTNYIIYVERFGLESYDTTYAFFLNFFIHPDLDNIDEIMDYFGNFFDEEDAILKMFHYDYAKMPTYKVLTYLKTDDLGKIKNGILLDFQNKNLNEKNPYKIYKKGKVVKFGTANLNDFQNIYINYSEKLEENE